MTIEMEWTSVAALLTLAVATLVWTGCCPCQVATPAENTVVPAAPLAKAAPQPTAPTPDVLEVGSAAPDFNVLDEKGNAVSLRGFRGKKNVVLVFYPGDDTPGCTKQLCAIRDDIADFEKADVAPFGVNPQNAESHQRFVSKFQFPFPLLVDEGKKMAHAYRCEGRFTKRTVYGIGKNGTIVFAQRGMPSDEEILAAFGE